MAYTTINKGSLYMNTLLYTGTGSGGSNRQLTGVGFQPDFTWVKSNSAQEHVLANSVRGATSDLDSAGTTAEQTTNTRLGAFISDGFQLGSGAVQNRVNENAVSMTSWNWLADNTSGSSNTDGSITSTVSANTTSGFSIVSWTGSGADATIGHGLNSAPTIYIVKNLADATDWRVGQVITSSNNMTDGNGYYMELNDTKASTNPGSAVTWGSPPTAPTSSVFTVGSNNSHNGSSDAMLAYCFHSVKGYSKMGSYTGNGNADGTFIYTGFKPAWLMIKRTDTVNSWIIQDNKRDPFNVVTLNLNANAYGGNNNNQGFLDFTSNGFKLRKVDTGTNTAGGTYIYMAFAQNPLVGTNNVPATAR